jgi:DNA-binding MarR family transcriptional regulator
MPPVSVCGEDFNVLTQIIISVYTLKYITHRQEDNMQPLAMNVANCTCANLRKVTRVVTQAYDVALKPAGLKATQFSLLATLANRGDTPLTLLATTLLMDRTTLTRNLKPMVRRGLIRIEQEEDQRVRKICLTEEGKQIYETALPLWEGVQLRIVESLGQHRWSRFQDDIAATIVAV